MNKDNPLPQASVSRGPPYSLRCGQNRDTGGQEHSSADTGVPQEPSRQSCPAMYVGCLSTYTRGLSMLALNSTGNWIDLHTLSPHLPRDPTKRKKGIPWFPTTLTKRKRAIRWPGGRTRRKIPNRSVPITGASKAEKLILRKRCPPPSTTV